MATLTRLFQEVAAELRSLGPWESVTQSVLGLLAAHFEADAGFWFVPKSGQFVTKGHSGMTREVCEGVFRAAVGGTAWSGPVGWTNRESAPNLPRQAVMVPLGKSGAGCLGVARFAADAAAFEPSAGDTLGAVKAVIVQGLQRTQAIKDVRGSLVSLVRTMSATIDARDPYTAGHSERVAKVANYVARQMGLSWAQINDTYLAGLLHDIGKIGIRDAVLLKAGPLTDREYEHVKQHTIIGDQLIARVPYFANMRPGVRSHHERVDGTGYPDGLAGDDIPLIARVLAVADACDAMMSARSYRPARPPKDVLRAVQRGAGTQFDPKAAESFEVVSDEVFRTIYPEKTGGTAPIAIETLMEPMAHNAEGTELFNVLGEPKD